MKRVGHGGTLDPAATGVLPIALGRATRLLQYLSHDKSYRATIRFGLTTATDDLEGEILTSSPTAHLSQAQVLAAIPQFEGVIQQIPPRYSAIHVDGKRLHELARAGIEVEVPVRTVEVYRIVVLDWRSADYPELEAEIFCGTGTYIRSIARDLGAVLQVGGTLAALIRLSSSGFPIAQSLTLEDLAEQLETGTFCPVPPEQALQHLPVLPLEADLAQRWGHGQKLPISDTLELGRYRIQDQAGHFLGIGEQKELSDGAVLVPALVWGE
jgi:tRNA pseudouridine55 synthase